VRLWEREKHISFNVTSNRRLFSVLTELSNDSPFSWREKRLGLLKKVRQGSRSSELKTGKVNVKEVAFEK
jgi:hypothetical protein